MGICYIVGAVDCSLPFTPEAGDLLLAADGGQLTLKKQGLTPDRIIGDFDSSPLPTDTDRLSLFPCEKDDTDTLLAIKHALSLGYRSFRIYGGLGGRRFDHSIANIQALSFLAENGAEGILVGNGQAMTVLNGGKFTLPQAAFGYVSVFSLAEESVGVCIEGLHWELQDATLTNRFPIGVSNRIEEAAGGTMPAVSLKRGQLLIIWEENG